MHYLRVLAMMCAHVPIQEVLYKDLGEVEATFGRGEGPGGSVLSSACELNAYNCSILPVLGAGGSVEYKD